MRKRFGVVTAVCAVACHPYGMDVHAPRGARIRAMTLAEAVAALRAPCPPGAAAQGWSVVGGPTTTAWCQDERGLLQGVARMSTEDRSG
jgi:hypothetical protein